MLSEHDISLNRLFSRIVGRNCTGRADTEIIVLLVSLIAGFLGGWLFGGSLLYGIAGAIALPVALIVIVVGGSYIVNRLK